MTDLDHWLRDLARVTGTITLRAVSGKPSTTRRDLRAWVAVLRRVADAMEARSAE